MLKKFNIVSENRTKLSSVHSSSAAYQTQKMFDEDFDAINHGWVGKDDDENPSITLDFKVLFEAFNLLFQNWL